MFFLVIIVPNQVLLAICKGGQFHLQIDVNDSYCSNLGVLMAILQHSRSFQHYSQAEICCNFIVIAAAATLKILGFHTSKCKLAIINMVIIASLHRLLRDGDCLTGEQCCGHFIVQNKANCDLTWGNIYKVFSACSMNPTCW
jgi:hypothetical protein